MDAWGACGARERCLGLRYRGMRRNISSCTSREVNALLDQLVATCTPHLQKIAGPKSPLCHTGSHILPSLHITSNPSSHTRPYRSRAGPPSNCSVSVWADVTHDEYERHRACPSVKRLSDQPSRVPLHTHLERCRSVELRNLPFNPRLRAPRAGVLVAVWRLPIGTDIVPHNIFFLLSNM